MKQQGLAFGLALALVVFSAPAHAGNTIPAPGDLGIGPDAFFFFGPAMYHQALDTGLKISLATVLDQDWEKAHLGQLTPRYQKFLNGADEVPINTSVFIPDALIITPKVLHTGMYGATWKPLAYRLPLTSGVVRLRLQAALDVTYAYIYSDLPSIPTTHFIRPGASLGLDLRFRITHGFLLSLGWESTLYVPQELGGFGFGNPSDWIAHVGQAYLKLHFRFPYDLHQ